MSIKEHYNNQIIIKLYYLRPHAEHGSCEHVVLLVPQADLALLSQGRRLAVTAPGVEQIKIINLTILFMINRINY